MLLQITPMEGGLSLQGELDMSTADDLAAALKDASTEGGSIVLDFSGVSFMDSSGLRVILEALVARGGTDTLVILRPTSQVQRVLDISIPGGTPGLEVRA